EFVSLLSRAIATQTRLEDRPTLSRVPSVSEVWISWRPNVYREQDFATILPPSRFVSTVGRHFPCPSPTAKGLDPYLEPTGLIRAVGHQAAAGAATRRGFLFSGGSRADEFIGFGLI